MYPPISGRYFFESEDHYDVLSYLQSGLMLDVGASNGAATALMLKKSPASRVIAFEPFAGNLPVIRERLGADKRVQIIEKAVSDVVSEQSFFVSSTVKGGSNHFPKGYSSHGKLVPNDSTDPARTFRVSTVPIDEVVRDRTVRFLKIDVQGGELGVLRSAKKSIDAGRIDVLQVEFSGEEDVYSFLMDAALTVFDTRYVLVPDSTTPDISAWDILREFPLSTGRNTFRAWPKTMPTTASAYMDFIKDEQKKIGNIFTDLLCVSSTALPAFMSAAVSVRDPHAASTPTPRPTRVQRLFSGFSRLVTQANERNP